MKTIQVSEFKAKCLRILEEIEPEGILITKRGRPIARIIRATASDNSRLIGSMKDSIDIKGDLLSTGVRWNAESRHAHAGRSPKRRAK
jgi:prevent-host-death family protein